MATHRSAVVLLVSGVLLLLLAPAAAAAPGAIAADPLPQPAWTVEINGPAADSHDEAVDVKPTSGGVTWVCGNGHAPSGKSDISLTKIVDGVQQWTKWWDSPYHRSDFAAKMALAPNGDVYVTGSSSNGRHADMILLKWSSSGVLKWVRRYDGPGHKSDVARLVGVDGAGNVTISGWTNTNNQGEEWVVRSYTAGGSARWTWMHDEGPFQALPADQCVLGNGTIYLTGGSTRVIGSRATHIAVSARLSASGKLVWLRRYAGPNGRGATGHAIARCPLGGVYVAGSASESAYARGGLVMRYSATGRRTVFALEPGGDQGESFVDVAVTSNGRIVAVGVASDHLGNTFDGPVTIYSPSGRIAADITWPGAHDPVGFTAVAADSSGGFSVVGSASGQLAVLRGSTLAGAGGWAALYGDPASYTQGDAIAVQGSTTVVVGSAPSSTPSQSYDQLVLGWVD